MPTCQAEGCKRPVPPKQAVCFVCAMAGKAPKPPAPAPVTVLCAICNKSGSYPVQSPQNEHKVCSPRCLDILKLKNSKGGAAATLSFLFSVRPDVVAEMFSDQTLARLAQVSKEHTGPATKAQLGGWYGNHTAIHYDKTRGQVEIQPRDAMEIAVQAYQAATKLKSQGKPVILYRVKDRGALSKNEELDQTVAGAAKTEKNLWPLERTAAWIQGAMRARVSFVLLTDPRAPKALIGGKDKNADAVLVRELFQITQTGYTIEIADDKELPESLRKNSQKRFKLVPPVDKGQMPVLPRMSRMMRFDHTWDSAKSSLNVDDNDRTTMAEHLVDLFTKAGDRLKVKNY